MSPYIPNTIISSGGTDVVQGQSGGGNIRIPGMTASPDVPLNGVGDDEFEVTSLASWTSMGTPTTIDANTTFASHLYIAQSSLAGVNFKGIYKAATPAFVAVAKMTAFAGSDQFNQAGLFIAEATPGNLSFVGARNPDSTNLRLRVGNYNSPTGSDQGAGTEEGVAVTPLYLAIFANSNDDVDFYYSYNGMMFSLLLGNYNPSWSIGAVGLCISAESTVSNGVAAAFDWFRMYTPIVNA